VQLTHLIATFKQYQRLCNPVISVVCCALLRQATVITAVIVVLVTRRKFFPKFLHRAVFLFSSQDYVALIVDE
jgi:hypothetical protein